MKNETQENWQRQIYSCFSQLLDYPTPNLVEQIRTGIDLLKKNYQEAAAQLEKFLSFVENTPMGRLEEVYTGTFDINPACHIFAGHILFGESFKRGAFMAKIEEEYQERHFDKGKELTDKKMNANFKGESSNPYAPVLDVALVLLKACNSDEPSHIYPIIDIKPITD